MKTLIAAAILAGNLAAAQAAPGFDALTRPGTAALASFEAELPEAKGAPAEAELRPEVKALSDTAVKLLTDESSIGIRLAMVGPMLGLMAFTGDIAEITEEMDLALAGAKASAAGMDEARRLLELAALAPRDEANSRAITGAAAMIEKAPSFLETAVREMAKIKKNSKKLHPKLQALDAELASLQGKLPELTALAARVKALHGA